MKKLLSLLLVFSLSAAFAFSLVACGNKSGDNGGSKTPPAEATEKGKTYAVANADADVKFYWANNDEKAAILGENDENLYRAVYAGITLAFDNDGNVTATFSTLGSQKTAYVVNEKNCIEFYDDGDKLTEDMFGYEYKFNPDKTKITITADFGQGTSSYVVFVLTVR